MIDHPISPVITCRNLNIYYRQHHILSDISGVIHQGSLTAIVGPNGGGKSTFLKALMGLIPKHSGHINFASHRLTEVAYLPQNNLIDRSFPITVFDFISSGHISRVGLFKQFSEQHHSKTLQAVESLGLQECVNKPIAALSGGQFQRCLFARLSLQDCPIIFLDEPFTAIDEYTIEVLQNIIVTWQKAGKTILTVCHDLSIVRQYYPHSILIARQCIGWGATEHILTPENWHQAKRLSTVFN